MGRGRDLDAFLERGKPPTETHEFYLLGGEKAVYGKERLRFIPKRRTHSGLYAAQLFTNNGWLLLLSSSAFLRPGGIPV